VKEETPSSVYKLHRTLEVRFQVQCSFTSVCTNYDGVL